MSIKRFFIFIFLFAQFAIASAQENCPTLVEEALNRVGEICANTARNQACYGNLSLVAEPFSPTIPLNFDAPGDKASITNIRSLRLRKMDESVPEWGLALINVQTTSVLSILPGQNITILLFGDVQLTAAEPAFTKLLVKPKGDQPVNLRANPHLSAKILDTLSPLQTTEAIGRLVDASWLLVPLSNRQLAWVSANVVEVAGDVQSLSIYQANTTHIYGPMKAFYLQTGVDDAICQNMPESGILIQTPPGAGKIGFFIDGVQITIGSTVYLQAEAGQALAIYVLDGEATVSAFAVTRTVPAGGITRVPIDDNLTPTGEPNAVEPYDDSALQAMPIELLPIPITIAPPLIVD